MLMDRGRRLIPPTCAPCALLDVPHLLTLGMTCGNFPAISTRTHSSATLLLLLWHLRDPCLALADDIVTKKDSYSRGSRTPSSPHHRHPNPLRHRQRLSESNTHRPLNAFAHLLDAYRTHRARSIQPSRLPHASFVPSTTLPRFDQSTLNSRDPPAITAGARAEAPGRPSLVSRPPVI